MTFFRGFFQLSVLFCVLAIQDANARAWPEIALAKIQPQTLERFLYADERELIILFDDTHIAEQSRQKKISSGLQYENNEILSAKHKAYRDIKNAVLEELNPGDLQLIYAYESLPMVFSRIATPEVLLQLLENEGVAKVFENARHSLSLAESLPLIGQPESLAAGHEGLGTSVAVLDTGVDYARDAFGSCTAPGIPGDCSVVFAQDFTYSDDGEFDSHGHGSGVAGTVLGVAPGTKIISLDVFSSLTVYSADAIAAVDWVIANQADYNIVAMNLSFGRELHTTECSQSWATVPFANARAVGVVPIAASGNQFETSRMLSPACAPGAISVGAVYDTKAAGPGDRGCGPNPIDADVVACFSNVTPFLDFLAPGVDVTAAGVTLTGTSLATPHVAGAYAVLKGGSAYPEDSIEQTIDRLKTTGKQVLDDRVGLMFPRIDLASALFDKLPDQVPEISGFEPGSAAEGEFIQIRGSGFRGVDAVLVGGTPAHEFKVNSSQLITVNVGHGSSGEISVSTSVGSDSLEGFTYIGSTFESEPNNSLIQANPVTRSGERISGGLSDKNDMDVFRFGFDTGEVSFGIRPVRSACCSRFIQAQLQDSQGNVLAAVRVDESKDEPARLQADIGQRGTYFLAITETAEQDEVFVQDYQVSVPENMYQNMAPSFTSVPSDVVFVGHAWTYTPEATDPDGDAVYYSMRAGPKGMVIDPQSGTVTWRPDSGQAGYVDVELSVADDFGGFETQRFQIAVIDSDQLDVEATDGVFKNYVRVSFKLVDGANVYRVFRCEAASETCGSPVRFVRRGFFNDLKAIPGILYHYRVRACKNTRCSPLSAEDSGFAAIAPDRPTAIRATDGVYPDRVRLSFNPVEGAVHYRVFRCLDKGQTCGSPVGFPRETVFEDKGAEPGKVYYYRVKACNRQHCGKFSVANAGHVAAGENNLGGNQVNTNLRAQPKEESIPALGVGGRLLLILLLLGLANIHSLGRQR